MIRIEDCEIEREPGWNRIRHLPTDRCVVCEDDSVTDTELFSGLCQALDMVEENKDLDRKGVMFSFKDQAN